MVWDHSANKYLFAALYKFKFVRLHHNGCSVDPNEVFICVNSGPENGTSFYKF